MHLKLKIVPTPITKMLIEAAMVTCQNDDVPPEDYLRRIADSYEFKSVLVSEDGEVL